MLKNIFRDAETDTVLVETLVESENVMMQRIVARGQALKPDSFGPQGDNNFLLLLNGQLTIETENEKVNLTPGGYIVTTPNQKIRVDSTSQDGEAVLLSVHFPGEIKEGLFPSPDDLILKRIKENMKRNVMSVVRIDSLVETRDLRVERIVAIGQSYAEGDCEQPWNQFVNVLKGQAVLELENEVVRLTPENVSLQGSQGEARLLQKEKVSLMPGDFICIAPHISGRVDSTSPDEETVMLSIYFGGSTAEGKYKTR